MRAVGVRAVVVLNTVRMLIRRVIVAQARHDFVGRVSVLLLARSVAVPATHVTVGIVDDDGAERTRDGGNRPVLAIGVHDVAKVVRPRLGLARCALV